jgi:tetratricopeptide (TPR) repeat protein
MSSTVLIAHAEGEENLAEKLAVPLREAGYVVEHQGTADVGESITEHINTALASGGPVVLCGTVRAMGTGGAHRVVNAAKPFQGVRVFAVQMEREAYLDQIAPDTIVAEYWKDPATAIRRLLDALKKHFPPRAAIEPAGIERALLRKYLLAVRGKYTELPEAYRGTGSRSLSDIYTRQLLEPAETASAASAEVGQTPVASGTLSVDELVLAGKPHLIIEGGPGAGKSTLLNHVACHLANAWLDDKLVTALPVLTRAGNFHANLDRPLSDLLHRSVTQAFGAEWQDTSFPEDMFSAPPAPGLRWLVLIDALDEIALPVDRERVLTAVRNRNPEGTYRFVVTTRPLPDTGVIRSSTLARYRVKPFDLEALKSFARSWFHKSPEVADSFVRSLTTSGSTVQAQIPLLVTVSAALADESGGRIQANRAELYEEFVRFILKWKADQRSAARNLHQSLDRTWTDALGANGTELVAELFAGRRQMLEQISLDRFRNPTTSLVNASFDFVLNEICTDDSRRRWLLRARESVEELLPDFLRSMGLLAQRGGACEFIHDTFREFLTAAALAVPRCAEEARAIVQSWHKSGYREVALFLLGRWSAAGKDVSELVESLGVTAPVRAFVGTAIAEGVALRPEFEGEVIQELLELARFTWYWEVVNSLGKLSTRPKVIDCVAALTQDPSVGAQRRIELCRMLESIGRQDLAAEGARRVIATPSVPVLQQLEACYLLEQLGHRDEAQAAIRRQMEHSDVVSRVFVIHTGALLGVPEDELSKLRARVIRDARHPTWSRSFRIVLITLASEPRQLPEILETELQQASAEPNARCTIWETLAKHGRAAEARRELTGMLANSSLKLEDRVRAAVALVKTNPDESSGALITSFLGEPQLEAKHRVQLANALGEAGRKDAAAGILREVVHNSGCDGALRVQGVKNLAALGLHEEAIGIMKALAEDSSVEAEHRIAAASWVSDPGYLPHTAELMRAIADDTSSKTADRASAITVLGRIGLLAEMANRLRRLLTEGRMEAPDRLAIASTLAEAGFKSEARQILVEAADDLGAEDEQRIQTAGRLAALGFVSDAEPFLSEIADHGERWDRERAIQALAAAGLKEEARAALKRALADPSTDEYFRVSLAKIFAQLGFPPEARQVLCGIASDVNITPYNRVAALEALGEIGFAEEADTTLLDLANESGGRARIEAAKALTASGSRDAGLGTLRSVLNDDDATISDRVRAADELRTLGFVDESSAVVKRIALAGSGDARGRIAAAELCLKLGLKQEAAGCLTGVITSQETDSSTAYSAMYRMLEVGLLEESRHALHHFLENPTIDSSSRSVIVDKAVKAFDSDAVRAPLVTLSSNVNADAETRFRAGEKLIDLGFGEATMDTWLVMIREPGIKSDMKLRAARHLQKLGVLGDSVAEALRPLAADRSLGDYQRLEVANLLGPTEAGFQSLFAIASDASVASHYRLQAAEKAAELDIAMDARTQLESTLTDFAADPALKNRVATLLGKMGCIEAAQRIVQEATQDAKPVEAPPVQDPFWLAMQRLEAAVQLRASGKTDEASQEVRSALLDLGERDRSRLAEYAEHLGMQAEIAEAIRQIVRDPSISPVSIVRMLPDFDRWGTVEDMKLALERLSDDAARDPSVMPAVAQELHFSRAFGYRMRGFEEGQALTPRLFRRLLRSLLVETRRRHDRERDRATRPR